MKLECEYCDIQFTVYFDNPKPNLNIVNPKCIKCGKNNSIVELE